MRRATPPSVPPIIAPMGLFDDSGSESRPSEEAEVVDICSCSCFVADGVRVTIKVER